MEPLPPPSPLFDEVLPVVGVGMAAAEAIATGDWLKAAEIYAGCGAHLDEAFARVNAAPTLPATDAKLRLGLAVAYYNLCARRGAFAQRKYC